jgi:two-component system, NarL family, response regulator NreC
VTVRILIADDHGVLRAALRSLLQNQQGMEVVGEAGDGHEALRKAAALEIDLLLLDISMPGLDGIAVTREMKKVRPEARVLVLTVHEDEVVLREAITAGASGYIIKRAAESELINAINAVMRGELYVHPAVTRALLAAPVTASYNAPVEEELPETLTSREVQVLRLIIQGYTNLQIADSLNLSVRTVESHRANIMGKLGLHNRAELVRYAMSHGLLSKI